METKTCSKCGATWINGQHFWLTGHMGNEDDLAGLVCNVQDHGECINPAKGSTAGQSWEKRMAKVDAALVEVDRERLEDQFRLDK